MTEFFPAVVSGVAQGIPLFLVASGLTIIFGVMGVLNFAHGAFFMLGALWFTLLVGGQAPTLLILLLAANAVAIAVGLSGIVAERLVLRPVYSGDHVMTLLATYALLLVMTGGAEAIWGNVPRTQRRAEALDGNVQALSATIPVYDIFLMAVGLVVAAGLWFLLQRTEFGRRTRAIAQDSTMAAALGINAGRTKYLVFGIGSMLAGLAGALAAPLVSVAPSVGGAFVLQSFAVVIVGGLGSVAGSFIAAISIGLAESLATSYFPALTGFTMYIAVALVLLFRPQGIMGSAHLSENGH